MEQKNLLLAVILSVGFLLVWSMFVMPHFTPPPAPPAPITAMQGTADGAATSVDRPSLLPDATAIVPEVAIGDTRNDIVLSAHGGGIKSWQLKFKGRPVELVAHPDVAPLPLATFPETLFKIENNDTQAVMKAVLPNGVRVTKVLTLNPTGFLNQLIVKFENPTAQPIVLKNWEWSWGPGLGTAESEQKENARNTRAMTLVGTPTGFKARILKEGEPQSFGSWAAIDNRYFLVAVIPQQAPPQLSINGKKDQTVLHLADTTSIPARSEVTLKYGLYVGPKGYTQLKGYGQHLEEAVDFGRFSPLGRLILRALYRLEKLTGNYGWSIILLTIFLQLCLSPLTLKSFKAAQAMKKLQPQIAALQAKFKGDPKRLNIEMMNIYKKTGTNPFGGCLPMVVQLPIFWALFTTLRNAYELRGAPFIFWIHDLSIADPYRILPIVMGGAMFLQQRMSAAVTDPTQRQMMVMMPVIFTVMFMNFPAGLVLYWLTNNLITMTFQYGYLEFTKEKPGTPDRPQIIA